LNLGNIRKRTGAAAKLDETVHVVKETGGRERKAKNRKMEGTRKNPQKRWSRCRKTDPILPEGSEKETDFSAGKNSEEVKMVNLFPKAHKKRITPVATNEGESAQRATSKGSTSKKGKITRMIR